MTNYSNGRAREYRIMKSLEARGYIVARTAGSHSPIDIFAIHPKELKIIFVQSKPKSMSKNAKARIEKEFSWINNKFSCNFQVVSLGKEIN